MSEKVHVVTTLPTKTRCNPKIVAGVVLSIAAVGALALIKGKLSASDESDATDTPAA